MKYETWNDFKDDCGECKSCVNSKDCEDYNFFTFSTTIGCSICNNEKVYLVQCDKVVWKICDKCKTVFFCQDAIDTFTDFDLKRWLKENSGKSLEDYKKEKLDYLENKYSTYRYMQHPATN